MSKLIAILGPVIAIAGFLYLFDMLGQPSALMLALTVLSAILSIVIACVIMQRRFPLSGHFFETGYFSLGFCIIMTCSFVIFWAFSEETYIHFFVAPDPEGMERYIYLGNSGMGFARGVFGLPHSLLEGTIAAVALSIIWTPILYGLLVVLGLRNNRGQLKKGM